MYRQMGYEDIIRWADNKIREKSFEIPSPFSIGVSTKDAIRELVLENCLDIKQTSQDANPLGWHLEV